MDGARHLLPEDRPDYELVLDEGLRRIRRSTGRVSQPEITTEQLRHLALDALPLVTLRAAEEYQRYRDLRDRQRLPDRTPASLASRGSAPAHPGAEPSGAGVLAALSVLVPVLAGVAAVIFLAVGYGLRLTDPEPTVAGAMRTTGWVFAVLAVVGLLVAAAELVVGAVRNDSTAIRVVRRGTRGSTELAAEVGQARQEWLEALLERGVLPFLQEASASGASAGATAVSGRQPGGARAGSAGRTATTAEGDAVTDTSEERYPHPEYSRPGYSSGQKRSDSGDKQTRFLSPRFDSPTDRSSEDAESRSVTPGFFSPRFETSDQDGSASDGGSSHGYGSPRYQTPEESVSGGKFGSPAYRTPEESVSGGKFGSPAYGTSGGRSDGGSGGASGKRFATTGYSTPGERADGDSSPGGGSRFGTRGYAGPKQPGSEREERDRGSASEGGADGDDSGDGRPAAGG